jgi:uncharacterized protein (DUF697 family)
MSVAAFKDVALEVRNLAETIQGELATAPPSEVVVSGMLADQLARELSTGAEPGAVLVGAGAGLGRAGAAVHVIAGDPTADDEQRVREADAHQVPIVLVQLWPQAEWTRPYVLSPFVVECRAGEGFPVGEIAKRIAEGVDGRQSLARRIPVLRGAVASRIVKEATVRAAVVGLAGDALGPSRPLLALEQVRMVSRLASLRTGSRLRDGSPVVAGMAAMGLGSGLALRQVARVARRAAPGTLVNAVLAAAATWALGKAARRFAEIDVGSD